MEKSLRTTAVFALLVLCPAAGLARGEGGTDVNEHVFDLEYVRKGFFLLIDIKVWVGEVSFEKEPDFGGRQVIRGLIPAGQSKEDYIGYAWDREEGRLYLDLNRNRDLTDDANGVFKSENVGAWQVQVFEDVGFTAETSSVAIQYAATGAFYVDSRGWSSLQMNVRSGFSGEIELHGRKWHVDFADNMDSKAGAGDYFNVWPAGMEWGMPQQDIAMPLRENVYLDGRLYALGFEFKAGVSSQAVLKMRLREKAGPVGKVNFEGEYVKRLVLENDSTLVPVYEPTKELYLPAGDYSWQGVFLERGESKTFRATSFSSRPAVSVGGAETATIVAGGPLHNTVSVERTGSVLTLSHKVVGLGGHSYSDLAGRRDAPPTFAVFKGERRIGSGKFEYG